MDSLNWHSIIFLLFALLAGGFAVGVVLATNVVRMAFYLILSLGATAGLFFLAGADFVGSMQLMIYVGGTLVLLIFGVMLTAQGPFVSMKSSGGDWILAVVVAGCLTALLVPAAFSVKAWRHGEAKEVVMEATATPIGLGLLGVRVDKTDPAIPAAIKPGLSGYLLPFEIISVHLLVVLVGAAYLARTKRRRDAA